MATEFTNGQTQVFTKAIGKIIRSEVTVSILGMMGGHTKDTGTITTCTVKESIPGPMVVSMKEST